MPRPSSSRRKPLAESASFWAQGGLAAALAADDSPERHAADTLAAGRGLCRASGGRGADRRGAGRGRRSSSERGVRFDTDPDGELALGLEGGHSARRIVHAGGSRDRARDHLAAGRAWSPTSRGSRCSRAPRRVALWSDGDRCAGVVTDRGPVRAPATVLATGGGAALWRRTTNPWGAIGAGLGPRPRRRRRARRPRVLPVPSDRPRAFPGPSTTASLITEAVRGEGAKLLDAAGRRFTDELAPRDAGHRRDPRPDGGRRHRLGVARPAGPIDLGRFPNVFATLRGGGPRRRARAGAGRPRRPLPDRGRRARPRGPNHAARPARGRRVRVHRRFTAPTGSPPTRSASASSSARRAAAAPPSTRRRASDAPGAGGVAVRTADGSDARRGLALRRAAPRGRRARGAARRPVSACAADRRRRPEAP